MPGSLQWESRGPSAASLAAAPSCMLCQTHPMLPYGGTNPLCFSVFRFLALLPWGICSQQELCSSGESTAFLLTGTPSPGLCCRDFSRCSSLLCYVHHQQLWGRAAEGTKGLKSVAVLLYVAHIWRNISHSSWGAACLSYQAAGSRPWGEGAFALLQLLTADVPQFEHCKWQA